MLHSKNCRNHAGRSFFDLTSTTISDDLEHWSHIVGYNHLLKLLSFFGGFYWIFFLWGQNWEDLWGLFSCVKDTETLDLFFFPLKSTSCCLLSVSYGLFGLIGTRHSWRKILSLPLMWSCILKVCLISMCRVINSSKNKQKPKQPR